MKYKLVRHLEKDLMLEGEYDWYLVDPKYTKFFECKIGDTLELNVEFQVEYFHPDYCFAIPKK